jgi:hypothetical protein
MSLGEPHCGSFVWTIFRSTSRYLHGQHAGGGAGYNSAGARDIAGEPDRATADGIRCWRERRHAEPDSNAAVTDTCDPSPSLTNNAPTILPVGSTLVTFTATDSSSNRRQAAMTVNVVYNFSRCLNPVLKNSSSSFKAGRTISVKFQLSAADGSVITNAVAHLLVAPYPGLPIGTTDITDATSPGNGDSGNLFRFDPSSGQYIFKLSTSAMPPESYLLRAVLNDGTLHDVLITLR